MARKVQRRSKGGSRRKIRGSANARNKILATWLLVLFTMVFVMVVLGGITRLNHAGLSMVDWKPITGWLPPMTELDWRHVFDSYRRFPEYRELNVGMTLAEFESIFWLEFSHRLWGRVLAVSFLIPFLVFLFRGWIDRPLAMKLIAAFVLGALQGVLGWFMVKSGLGDRPDVSQYRLAAHLALALAIFAYLLWLALDLLYIPARVPIKPRPRKGYKFALVVLAGIFLTVMSGAFVAGLDAGFAYNTFPLMDGALLPDGLFSMSPAYLNPFENITMVQFQHRLLAMTVLVAIVVFWLTMRMPRVAPRVRIALNGLLAMAIIQVGLGISTLMLIVPISLAAMHQSGALALFALIVWIVHELRAHSTETPA